MSTNPFDPNYKSQIPDDDRWKEKRQQAADAGRKKSNALGIGWGNGAIAGLTKRKAIKGKKP